MQTFGEDPHAERAPELDDDRRRDVLDALSPIVSVLPVDGRCLDRADATPAP